MAAETAFAEATAAEATAAEAFNAQLAAEAETAAAAQKAAERADSTRADKAAEAKPAPKPRQKKLALEKVVEEESDDASEASDVASDALSQYGQSELATEEFDERILNADASPYEAEHWPNILFDTAPHGESKRPLTGFPTELSDCEDGRADDLPAYPKKFKSTKTRTREWASSLQRITALKKDLNNVPLSTFVDEYTELMGPERSYKEYLLDLMGNGELSSLPEFIYVADANVTRKQAAQFWMNLVSQWHPDHFTTERDFAGHGLLDMTSRFTSLRDAYLTNVENEVLTKLAQERSELVHQSLALPGLASKRSVNERCPPLLNPEKARPEDNTTCFEVVCLKFTGKEFLAIRKVLPVPEFEGQPTGQLPTNLRDRAGSEEMVKVQDGVFWAGWDQKWIALVKRRTNRWFNVVDINPAAMQFTKLSWTPGLDDCAELVGQKAVRPLDKDSIALLNPETLHRDDVSHSYELVCIKFTGEEFVAVRKPLSNVRGQSHEQELVKVQDGDFWNQWDSKFISLVKLRKNKWFSVSEYCHAGRRGENEAGTIRISDLLSWSGGTISVMDSKGFHT